MVSLFTYFVTCVFVGDCVWGVMSSWSCQQLESFKNRRKSPHGGPYYYTALQPETIPDDGENNLAYSNAGSIDVMDSFEDGAIQVSGEHCDITETVELVYIYPSHFYST